jgi:hypothetical protein
VKKWRRSLELAEKGKGWIEIVDASERRTDDTFK